MSDPQTPEELFNARRAREQAAESARQEALAAAADIQRLEDAASIADQANQEAPPLEPVNLPPDETATPVAEEPVLTWEDMNAGAATGPQGPGGVAADSPYASDYPQYVNPEPQPSLPPRPTGPTKQPGARRKTRAEIAQAMAERQNSHVKDFWLPITQEWVRVRDLTFTDSVMLKGLPYELRGVIDAAIRNETLKKAAQSGMAANFSVEEAISGIEDAERLAIGMCIAGFVEPRLVLHEKDLVPGNENVWLVTDIDPTERIAYMNWTNRNRNQDAQGADAAARFPGAGVGSPADSPVSDQVR